jgi:(4-(4-[2-(gamma-L-glutamylamino)ethyl]phenoxymethyl)furan-2-yl)methanamine synthase
MPSPSAAITGWDIGGAHLKAALLDGEGRVTDVLQLPCALWQGMEHLDRAIRCVIDRWSKTPRHAITMTGEMADSFPTRADGVRAMVETMRRIVVDAELDFFAGGRGFVTSAQALTNPLELASINWLASAQAVAQRLDSALFVDIGSTTTDIVPIAHGKEQALGRDDGARLVRQELVYTGVTRTPVMALASAAPYAGDWTPLMAELFATSADVYRLTGELPADADQHPAADGGAKTAFASARRLARMLGHDAAPADLSAWQQLAVWFAERQLQAIHDACERTLSRVALAAHAPIVGAGVGRFVAAKLAQRMARPYREFAQLFTLGRADAAWVSSCAPAVAVAYLLSNR